MSNDPLIATGDIPDIAVCNIPAALFHAFPGRRVVLRTDDPAEPPAVLGPEVPERVTFVQLTGFPERTDPLVDWGEGLPLDLVMADPAAQFPFLYRYTSLLVRHPVRVTVPMLPGVGRAIKLAVSLGFAVRLDGHQPAPETVAEARQALDHYLHNPTVARPVEFFHGVLLAFLHDTPVSLWSLLEQDPAEVRPLDNQGQEVSDRGPASVTAFREQLLAAGAECRQCEWLSVCGGYFKWPRPEYSCAGVKALFGDLHGAATELRQALTAHAASPAPGEPYRVG